MTPIPSTSKALASLAGASDSLAFADPEHRLAVGYTTPNLWAELSTPFRRPTFRFEALTEAVYRSLGFRTWPRR